MSGAMTLLLLMASAAPAPQSAPRDPDTDGDGLSDFAERHKYGTDPSKRDTDGDGKWDGDRDERREYAYTVRSVVRLLPPVTADALTDDQQDGRVVRSTRDFVEIEVVHYPLNTARDAVVADPAWRKTVASRPDLAPFLKPGKCARFDAAMATELAVELAAAGTDPATADDVAVVKACTSWLLEKTKFEDGFTTFCFDLSGAKPKVQRGLETRVQEELARCGRGLDEQLERELVADGMFRRRVHGTCTSSAIFWTACLRALGIPTRGVLHIPLVDASDPEELGWIESNLEHKKVRRTIRDALAPLTQSWSSHTMVEVFVGGRWRLLNYGALGQPSLDRNYFGLMTHVATFADWSDAEASRTIGLRQCSGQPHADDDPFGHANPYSCIELDDRFGAHANLDNPDPDAPATPIFDALAWSDDPALPPFVRESVAGLDPPALLARCTEWNAFADVKTRTIGGDRRFFLEADGHPRLGLEVWVGGISYSEDGRQVAWVILPLGPADWSDLVVGATYRFRPRNEKPELAWRLAKELTIARKAK
jgi:hypothetical protein